LQPTFLTARLRLAPRTLADLEDCLAMDRDPDVTRFIPGPWQDPVAHRAFVLARMTTAYPDGLGYWTIRQRRNSGFLGWILLLPVAGSAAAIEIGWRLVREAWGAGFASEAAAAVLTHARAVAGDRCVVADIDPANAASIRVAQKIGMTDTGPVEDEGRPARRFAVDPMHPPLPD